MCGNVVVDSITNSLGVPDKTSVSVNYTSNKDRVVISVKVTDDSSVPATHILYHLQVCISKCIHVDQCP